MARASSKKTPKARLREPNVGRSRSTRHVDPVKPKHGPGKKSAKATRSRRTLSGHEPTRRTKAVRNRTELSARTARVGARQSTR